LQLIRRRRKMLLSYSQGFFMGIFGKDEKYVRADVSDY
jgi:hypothetical protein